MSRPDRDDRIVVLKVVRKVSEKVDEAVVVDVYVTLAERKRDHRSPARLTARPRSQSWQNSILSVMSRYRQRTTRPGLPVSSLPVNTNRVTQSRNGICRERRADSPWSSVEEELSAASLVVQEDS